MSAIELADKFDWSKTTYEIHTWCLEAQSMLRQQQAEIDALKLHIKKLQWALAEQTNLLGVKE